MERSDLLKKLVAEIDSANLHLNVNVNDGTVFSVGDEIFHLPSISFCILVLASIKKFNLEVPTTGHYVASTLQESVTGLKSSQSDLRWSFRLRSVCADSLDFLEQTKLINIDNLKIIKATENGRKFLVEACKNDSNLDLFKRGIIRGLERAITMGDRLL